MSRNLHVFHYAYIYRSLLCIYNNLQAEEYTHKIDIENR